MKSIAPATISFQERTGPVDRIHVKQDVAEGEQEKLLEACRDFEAILLNKLLTSMRDAIPEGGLFEKSAGEKMYQSLLDQEMTKNMAHGGGVGLGDLLFRQLNGALQRSEKKEMST